MSKVSEEYDRIFSIKNVILYFLLLTWKKKLKSTEKLQVNTKNFCISFTRIHQLLALALITLLLCISTCMHCYTLFFVCFSYCCTLKCIWVCFLRIRTFIHDHGIVKNFRKFHMDSLYRFFILHFPVLSLILILAFFLPKSKNHTLPLVVTLPISFNLEYFLSCFIYKFFEDYIPSFLFISVF